MTTPTTLPRDVLATQIREVVARFMREGEVPPHTYNRTNYDWTGYSVSIGFVAARVPFDSKKPVEATGGDRPASRRLADMLHAALTAAGESRPAARYHYMIPEWA